MRQKTRSDLCLNWSLMHPCESTLWTSAQVSVWWSCAKPCPASTRVGLWAVTERAVMQLLIFHGNRVTVVRGSSPGKELNRQWREEPLTTGRTRRRLFSALLHVSLPTSEHCPSENCPWPFTRPFQSQNNFSFCPLTGCNCPEGRHRFNVL
jgi:hypothetical protein